MFESGRTRWTRLVLGVVAGAMIGLVAVGCSGSDDARPGAAREATTQNARLLAVDEFKAYLAENPDVPLINVHVPYEGHIAGTDAFVPFDSIVGSSALPADKSAPIAIYCRSGNMSATAARDLRAAGYSNIVDLEGGMNAWVAAGEPLVQDPSAAGTSP